MNNLKSAADVALAKNAAEILPNLVFYGLGVGVVVLLGSWARWLGLLGFGFYALILLFSIVRAAIVVGSGLILLLMPRSPKSSNQGTEVKAWGATLIICAEVAVFAVYSGFLYTHFFPSPGVPA